MTKEARKPKAPEDHRTTAEIEAEIAAMLEEEHAPVGSEIGEDTTESSLTAPPPPDNPPDPTVAAAAPEPDNPRMVWSVNAQKFVDIETGE